MKFLIAIFLQVIVSEVVFAGGLSSPNASMYLGNLKIGQTYSLEKSMGMPFRATYKDRAIGGIYIGLQNATTTTADGFEPIPDIGWIKIIKDYFTVDPGEEVKTDILITIPNDEKYLGKKYVLDIRPETTAPRTGRGELVIGAGLLCRLRLEIAAKPPTAEEIRQLKKQALSGEMNVVVSPERIFLTGVPAGEKIDLKKKYNETLKIINSTEYKTNAIIKSVPVKTTGLFVPEGYKEADNPGWLSIKRIMYNIMRTFDMRWTCKSNKKRV